MKKITLQLLKNIQGVKMANKKIKNVSYCNISDQELEERLKELQMEFYEKRIKEYAIELLEKRRNE